MAGTWQRRVALSAAVVSAMGVCLTGTAQAAPPPVSYKCSYMSPIMGTGLGENFIIAQGCEGPAGTSSRVTFIDPPPWSAFFCTWAVATQHPDVAGLHVSGHSCVGRIT